MCTHAHTHARTHARTRTCAHTCTKRISLTCFFIILPATSINLSVTTTWFRLTIHAKSMSQIINPITIVNSTILFSKIEFPSLNIIVWRIRWNQIYIHNYKNILYQHQLFLFCKRQRIKRIKEFIYRISLNKCPPIIETEEKYKFILLTY